jgi:DNA-binding XRE family transcriptional regulator
MKIERDNRRFDFHDIGLAIKWAREASGMTQEQLAYIVDRAPRTIMYNENVSMIIFPTNLTPC